MQIESMNVGKNEAQRYNNNNNHHCVAFARGVLVQVSTHHHRRLARSLNEPKAGMGSGDLAEVTVQTMLIIVQ